MFLPIFLAFFVAAHGATVHDANVFMDQVLEREIPQLSQKLGMDPLKAQPYFSDLGTRDELRVFLKDVKITGLSQVRRSGDCSQPGYSSPGRLTVSCNVLLDRLSVHIVSDIRYMGGPERTVRTVATIAPNYALLEATAVEGRIPEVRLKPLKPFASTLNFTGLGDIPLERGLTRGFTYEVGQILKRELKSEYTEYIVHALTKVPFPL
ncbi:secreted protein, putative [Ixodes scapularis]|uniref:Secreted protein, putative n=1 Tax=Ixodes scapularis TaxID=6945 RepID=B7QKR7_IXOSC|nr:secreted protein, putative [Ixodes scapularis]|eukprot:XP_002415772.1 secreted protein, putative [Ixodes scapularis]